MEKKHLSDSQPLHQNGSINPLDIM